MSEKALTSATTVEQRFRDFLQANDLRQTRERFAILEAIYNINGTFTIEDLQKVMAETHFHVSTATLYNTTLLLVSANLLVRHPFSSSSAVFERIYDDHPRTYQVCNHCHHITLIKSRELSAAVQSYKPRRFNISHRITYIYGICPKCERIIRQKIKRGSNETINPKRLNDKR
jgi:Fur family ferric uptake transcriptional regulator